MPRGNRPGREPTPLEVLNRNHNWRQGSLRRLYVNCSIITDVHDMNTARAMVQAEIDRTRAQFEAAKQEILNA